MPRFAPEVEALLAHERTIPPPYDFTRARVLARARKSLKDGNLVSLTIPTLASHHLPYAAFVGLALVAATAAFQVLRGGSQSSDIQAQVATPQQLTSALEEAQAPQEPPLAQEPVPPAAAVAPAETLLPRAKSAVSRHDTAIEELALLEHAQLAAAHNDHGEVLVIARDHEARYPKGRLSEEREALRVRAMIGLGQLSEARQTAARFHRNFPRSVLLSRLDDMLASR
jgi:hypothetical protein